MTGEVIEVTTFFGFAGFGKSETITVTSTISGTKREDTSEELP
jgi:hypothetical protein